MIYLQKILRQDSYNDEGNGSFKMSDLVSVVVTCYNHEQYIRQCLESIEHQTYQKIELLIFNDGSTDSSSQVIEDFLSKTSLSKVSYYYHDNMGLVRTRNCAFDYITGDFLLFVDSDNYLTADYIEQLLLTAYKTEGDIIYTRLVNPDTNMNVLDLKPFSLPDLFKSNFIDSCSLIRRSIIGSIRYDDYLNGKRLEDFDFFLALIVHHQARPVPCDTTFFYYRVLDDSMSGQARDLMLKYYQAYVHILDKYIDSHPAEVRAASELHFSHQLQLAYYNQKIKIYYREKSSSFSEDNVLIYDLHQVGEVSFQLSENITDLRIDLSDIPSFYKRVSVVEADSGVEVEPTYSNGIFLESYLLFKDYDPQLYYDISSTNKRSFILSYEMFNVSDVSSSDYVVKELADMIQRLQDDVKKFSEDYDKLLEKCQLYRNELEEMTSRYQAVITSRRWTIPTKIIDLFRRNK
ncbi:glycosyltransferase family 2 protein [Streptococcus acidominimus]|nr:glycosyltransferase family A protein [Streptococcus acidominimus]MBF0818570.1 glycosyltransferase family 2 protein [Streptococcus acidominimus]